MPSRTDTSSIEVGSSAKEHGRIDRQRPGNGDALALAAGEFVRTALQVIGGGAQAHLVEQRHALLAHLGPRQFRPVDLDRPFDVMADGQRRIERAERVLEDHLDLAAVEARLPAVQRQDRAALKADVAA